MFLSTPPSRVATVASVTRWPRLRVSIHATLAGGDAAHTLRTDEELVFLSTPPSRVATFEKLGQVVVAADVSIHATLAGGDTLAAVIGGRTNNVSIHATLAGGDKADALGLSQIVQFLSTPPSRVATHLSHTQARIPQSFYPRHPRGWRRVGLFFYSVQ